MKITNATLVRLVKEEIKNLFKEADNNRTWLRNLSLAPPTSMAALRKGQSIAPGSSSSDRYPHFRHVNQAISLLYQEMIKIKEALQYDWEESYKGLFAPEGRAAEILKYTSDVNKAIEELKSSEFISKRDILDESFPTAAWSEIRNLLQRLQDILEDTIFDDDRFARATELFVFASQVVNARIEHIRAGFNLDPGGIHALVKIPAGVDYEKPEV